MVEAISDRVREVAQKLARQDDFQAPLAALAHVGEHLGGETNSTLDQAKTQYLDLSRQNGWITAVLWQRSMASIYAKLTSIVNSAQLNSTLPANPADYLPLFSSWREGYNAAVDQARRDMDFIVTFDTYFTTLGQATAPALATETVGSQSNEAQQVADLVNQVYRAVLTIIAQPEVNHLARSLPGNPEDR